MTTGTPSNHATRLVWAVVVLLLIGMAVVVTRMQLTMSPTFDEQNHVTRGISVLRTGDYRLVYHHPPLANVLEALPVAWGANGFSTQMSAWRPGTKDFLSIWSASYQTIWYGTRNGVQIIHWARVPVLLFTLVLGLVIFLWSRELFGPWGGLFSLTFFVLDPAMLAHSGLATTDIPAACTIVLAVYLLRHELVKPGRGALLLAGIGVGLALATKFSALILLPVIALTLLIFAIWPSRLHAATAALPCGTRILRAVGHGLLLLFIAGVTVWATYGGKIEALGSKPGIPVSAHASLKDRLPVPAMQYLRGIKTVSTQAEDHRAYLFGQTDTTGKGWWYYFPVAIATKTPLPELVCILGALLLLVIPRTRAQLALPRRELVFLLLPVGIYLLAALGLLGISLNLGIRHILPVYPFLFILCGGLVKLRVASRYYRPALAVLVLAQCASLVMAYPHYLAYFNEAAETRQEGYHILVDSNYDWGQDLAALADMQRAHQYTPLLFSYFGTTPPEAYGIRYTPLPGFGLMRTSPMPDLRHFDGYIAISVTDLMGGKGYTSTDYRFLQQMQPVARAGSTIFIYRYHGNATGPMPKEALVTGNW